MLWSLPDYLSLSVSLFGPLVTTISGISTVVSILLRAGVLFRADTNAEMRFWFSPITVHVDDFSSVAMIIHPLRSLSSEAHSTTFAQTSILFCSPFVGVLLSPMTISPLLLSCLTCPRVLRGVPSDYELPTP